MVNYVQYVPISLYIELTLGSGNKLFLLSLEYFTSVVFTYCLHGYRLVDWDRLHGNGSSILVYYQFTCLGGTLFLVQFFFPYINNR